MIFRTLRLLDPPLGPPLLVRPDLGLARHSDPLLLDRPALDRPDSVPLALVLPRPQLPPLVLAPLVLAPLDSVKALGLVHLALARLALENLVLAHLVPLETKILKVSATWVLEI